MVIQGLFYNIAPEKTRIDWWISTRDSILFMFYLGIMSAFMQGEEIAPMAIYILILLYIFHVVLMKFNYSYEVWLKKTFASILEVKELKKLAN